MRRWKDNIKMDVQEVGCGGMEWIELAQYRERWRVLVNAVMNLTLRQLMSYIYIYIYIYGAPILDVSRSHTTTQHSR